MWSYILNVQLLVYVSMWQINFPSLAHFLLFWARKMVLGEALDETGLADFIYESFGLEALTWSPSDMQYGSERLGQKSILANFGATNIIAFALLLIYILALFVIELIAKRSGKTKCYFRVNLIKNNMFFNPLINVIMLEALKVNLSTLVSLLA